MESRERFLAPPRTIQICVQMALSRIALSSSSVPQSQKLPFQRLNVGLDVIKSVVNLVQGRPNVRMIASTGVLIHLGL